MNVWFFAIICLDCLGLGMHLAKHGEEKVTKYNFISQAIGTMISLLITYMAIRTGF